MDLFTLINEQLNNKETLNKLGQSVGADPKQVQQLAQIGLPTLLQALGRNAETAEGAVSLAAALDQHQDDDIEDINGFLNKVDMEDGAKILSHIFSGRKDRVQKNLAKKTGLQQTQVSGLMMQFAPLLLGMLAKQKKENNVQPSALPGLLGALTSQSSNDGMMDLVSNLLDADDDGSIIDDVGNLLKGFLRK